MAFMTTCCTDTSMDMILCMYSCLSAQFTAQPKISCNNRPNSDVLQCSPEKGSRKQFTAHPKISCNNPTNSDVLQCSPEKGSRKQFTAS